MGDWYYTKGGQQNGPVSLESLKQMLASGQVSVADFAWTEGMEQWARISGIQQLGGSLALQSAPAVPPPIPPQPLSYASPMPRPIGDDPGMRWLLPVGRSGLAIAAGYAGLFSFLVFPGPIALLLSILAIRDIRKNPHKHGMGRAIFGLIMGILATALLGIFVVMMVINA